MRKLGKKQLILDLEAPIRELPAALVNRNLSIGREGSELIYSYDGQSEGAGIDALLTDLSRLGIGFTDLQTKESSLEEIFVDLVRAGQ
jgi:ABC-2 type transport system ATP-binding protein